MILDPAGQQLFLLLAGLTALDLVRRLRRERRLSRWVHLLLVLIVGLSFFLEIRWLRWPLLDLFLADAIGLLTGLHLVSLIHLKRQCPMNPD